MGPLLLFGLSVLVASSEERAESREVMVAGIEHAPSLRNFLERQTLQITTAPVDYERQLVERRLADPVVVVAAGFRDRAGTRRASLARSGDLQRQHARGGRRAAGAARAARVQSRDRDPAPDVPRRRAGHAGRRADRGARSGRSARARRAAHRHRAVLRADGGVVRRAQRGVGHHGRRTRTRFTGAVADDAGVAAGAGDRQVGRGGQRWHVDRGAELPELPARAEPDAQRHAGGAVSFRPARGRAYFWLCCCRWRRRCRR